MKNCFLSLFVLCFYFISFSQVRPPDRRDTIWAGSWQPWHMQVTNVPVLLNHTLEKRIEPLEKICFDKKILMKGNAGSRVLDIYLYINTTDGIIGIVNGREGSLGDGQFKIDDPQFRLLVISKKGNIYSYFNQKKKNEIVHYVSTSNSNNYLYEFGFTPGNDAVYKKTVRNIYCDNKFKTWSYKANGAEAPVLHLFGQNYPNKLVCKEFLGYSGVGYLHTDVGIFIACEMEKDGSNFEMRSFDDIEICFDPNGFKKQEDEFFNETNENIEKQKEKLDSKTFSGSCASEQTILNNFKKEVLNKKKGDLQQTQQGNTLQNRNTQKAYANLMDPIDGVQENIYSIDVKLCKARQSLSKAKGQENIQRINDKISCLNRQKSESINIKTQMQALDRTYSNNPAKAFTEKNKLMLQLLTNCN